MKAKKALKRLDHVESLLSDVIGQLAAIDDEIKRLLGSAKEEVSRAKKMLDEAHKPSARKKTATKKTAIKKVAVKKKPATKKSKRKAAPPKV